MGRLGLLFTRVYLHEKLFPEVHASHQRLVDLSERIMIDRQRRDRMDNRIFWFAVRDGEDRPRVEGGFNHAFDKMPVERKKVALMVCLDALMVVGSQMFPEDEEWRAAAKEFAPGLTMQPRTHKTPEEGPTDVIDH